MQKVTVTIYCDIPHDDEIDHVATETVTFAWLGKEMALDLCEEHRDALYGAVNPYVAHGRVATVKPGASTGPRAYQRSRNLSMQEMRRWAKDNGFTVSERGRVPHQVQEAYTEFMRVNRAGTPVEGVARLPKAEGPRKARGGTAKKTTTRKASARKVAAPAGT